jgi:hypothetical protein
LILSAQPSKEQSLFGTGGDKDGGGGNDDLQPLSGKAEGKDAEGDEDYAKSSAGDDKGSK